MFSQWETIRLAWETIRLGKYCQTQIEPLISDRRPSYLFLLTNLSDVLAVIEISTIILI